MKRIIVSGANGFLGSIIIRKAIEEEDLEVVAITSRPDKMKNTAKEFCQVIKTDEFIEGGFPFVCGDIFINCLFPTNADGYKMADGLEKVFKLMSVAKDYGVKAFINISSQSVYPSQRDLPAMEEDALSLETGYAVGKYCSEAFGEQIFSGLHYTSVRLASLLGTGYDQRIINRMVDQALVGKELMVVGGMQRFGFLDVRDAAEGILKMIMSNPKSWKQKYNLGRMESYTLIEVADCIVSQLKMYGIDAGYTVKEGMDARNSSMNINRFMKDFRWKPKIPLSKTIADIIESKINEAEKQTV